MQIVVVSNQKGGVGKTTTSNALMSGLAKAGNRVLGIDLDPQGNLSDSCGANNFDCLTMYEIMKGEADPKDAIQHITDYDIIPANIMLAGIEQELPQIGKEYRLKETLSPLTSSYDFIIIDTPPSLGVLTVNAFTFASDILIPTTAGVFAAKGIRQLSNTIKSVKKYCNPYVQIVGILLTRYNPRTNISKQIRELTEQLGEFISAPIYKTYIRSGIAIEEAQANSTDIFAYADRSAVAKDYKAFIDEFLKEIRQGGKESNI